MCCLAIAVCWKDNRQCAIVGESESCSDVTVISASMPSALKLERSCHVTSLYEGNVVAVHAMKVCRRFRRIVPLILNLGSRWN